MAICKQCGAEFEAKRSTAQYCSAVCRVYANRGKPVTVTATEPANVTETEPAPVDYSSLPAGVVRPLGARTEATRAMSDELIETRLAGLKTWQASPEYAERIGRLMAGSTTYNLPCWCRK